MKNWQKNISRWFFKYWMWLFLGLLASVNFYLYNQAYSISAENKTLRESNDSLKKDREQMMSDYVTVASYYRRVDSMLEGSMERFIQIELKRDSVMQQLMKDIENNRLKDTLR